jgi:Uma2 family endonuclease
MTTIPVEDDFMADDLAELPDDGNRYELVDGLLLVSPAPAERHQRAVAEMFGLLRAAAPAGLRVYVAPLDVRLSDRVEVQPDLVVAMDGPPRDRLDQVPLLCVEVLSPSTSRHDLVLKRRAYERGAVPSYWIVDPRVPSVTVLELVDGIYGEVAQATGADVLTVTAPFAMSFRPDDLLR